MPICLRSRNGESLGSDIHRIEQSLSFFMFGVAFGQVVGGSISDIKGRKPGRLVGLSIYLPPLSV